MTTAHSGDPQTLPRLADALTEVSSRLRDIGVELRTLQAGAGEPAPAATQPVAPAPAPYPAYQPGYQPYPNPPYQPQPMYPLQPPRYVAPPRRAAAPLLPGSWQPPNVPDRPTLWERVSREGAGSRVLAWVGGVVTLAGVVLLLVLAIQRGYVGPLPRVLLGAGLGLALVGIAMRLHPNDSTRTGAHALAATGFAVCFLSVIAATALYSYLPPWAGLAAGLAVAAAGILLAARWDAQLLAVYLVVCCAVSAPLVTAGFVPLLVGFLLVLQIATSPMQLVKRWQLLGLAAGLPPILATLVTVSLSSERGTGAVATAALCLATSLVQLVLATISAHRLESDDVALALLLTAPVPTMFSVVLVSRLDGALLVAALGVLLILGWAAHRLSVLALSDRFALASGAAGVLVLFEATCLALDGSARTIALLGAAVLLALAAVRLRYAAALIAAALFGATGLVLALADALPLRGLVLAPTAMLSRGGVVTAGMTGLLLAVAAVTQAWATSRVAGERDWVRPAWIAAAVVALYGASGAMLSIGLAVSPDQHGFLLGHVLVTVSWTLGALVLLLRWIDSTPLRVTGLALVAAALAKLVLFDLASLDGLPRVAAFLVAGLVLLAAGTRYAKLVATRGRAAHVGS